jgi:pyrroloquinoline quinone (PQQ) biosynthesis protein C
MGEKKQQLLDAIKSLYAQLETANTAFFHSKSSADEQHVRHLEAQMNEMIDTLVVLESNQP